MECPIQQYAAGIQVQVMLRVCHMCHADMSRGICFCFHGGSACLSKSLCRTSITGFASATVNASGNLLPVMQVFIQLTLSALHWYNCNTNMPTYLVKYKVTFTSFQ